MQSSDKVVVLGASAGGVEALKQIVAGLTAEFAAPLLVGLHVPARHTSDLPSILSRAGVLPARHPVDGERLHAGHIYIAPPGHDLMIVGYCAAVQPCAAQARFRPSLDALFQSAAHHHGPRSIGIVLSGALDDGTVGLRSIARAGGTTIVQSDAAFDSMPQSALAATRADHAVPASKVGALLGSLTERRRAGAAMEPGQHLEQVVRDIESAMRASSRHCAVAGDASSDEADLPEVPLGAALVRAEVRIALLQRFALRDDARASDRTVALQHLSALESCSGRLRWLMSRQRVWSYERKL
jgi:hypothetical protein